MVDSAGAGTPTGPGSEQACAVLRVSQGKYLPVPAGDGTPHEMQAIVEIETRGLSIRARGVTPPEAAEVIIVDCSGSMSSPPTKFSAARRAAAAAVEALRDGTQFAIVAGNESAQVAYPPSGGLAVAGPDTRREAVAATRELWREAGGGTSFATWLTLARRLLEPLPGAIRHVLLLTDGNNDLDPSGRLERVLDECSPLLSCDPRGIGADWNVKQLKHIGSRLHGEADGVRDDELLPDAFRDITEASMDRTVPDLRIRITHRLGSRLRVLRQRYPTTRDLTPHGARIADRTWEFVTRAWGEEVREYELSVLANPRGDEPGEDVQLAYVELYLAHGPDTLLLPDPAPVLVHWTEDEERITRLDPIVELGNRRTELARAIEAGCAAYASGDRPTAAEQWGHGVRLATELHDWGTLSRLGAVVAITDAERGEVTVREPLRPFDLNSVLVASERTVPLRRAAAPGQGGPEPGPEGPRVCPGCGRLSPPTATYCTQCGERLAHGEATP